MANCKGSFASSSAGAPTLLARIGIMKALHRHDLRELKPSGKKAHWGSVSEPFTEDVPYVHPALTRSWGVSCGRCADYSESRNRSRRSCSPASPVYDGSFARMVERAGVEANLPFKAHPHMLDTLRVRAGEQGP